MTSFGLIENGGMNAKFIEAKDCKTADPLRKQWGRRVRVTVASVALVAMTSPAFAAPACENTVDFKEMGAAMVVAQSNVDAVPRGERAKAVRFLQSELMVAALACNARQHYGNFVKRYKVSLVSSGKDLKNHFEKAHGQKKGFAELNRFVTRLANKASGRMASLGADFCATMHETYDHLLSDEDVHLAGYSLGYREQVENQNSVASAKCDEPRQLSAVPQ